MIERKKIEGERLTDPKEALERLMAKRKVIYHDRLGRPVNAQKHPKLSIRALLRVRYYNFKQTIRRRIMSIMTSQTEKAIRKQIGDATWYGKLLFAILDVLPLPNIHEVWKAVQKEIPDAPIKDKIRLFWQKIDGVRTSVGILVALIGYYGLLS